MKINLLYIFIFISSSLQAQSLSIQDLWNQLDETNSSKLKQIQTKVSTQELQLEQLNRLPIIYADANVQRNLIIPTTPVPAIAFNPNAQDGAILPLKFATKWNAKAGLQAEWKLFDPNRKPAIDEKKILLEKSQIDEKINTQNLKKDATLAYVSVVLATLQYQSAVRDTALYNQILETIVIRYHAGRENLEQYTNAQEEFERKKIQLYETWAVLKEADLELQKYIDPNNIKHLTSNIESISQALQGYENLNFEAEHNIADIKLNDIERKSLKRQLLPSLTFNAYYGSQYFNNSFRMFNTDNWFGNSYANVALRIPISAYLAQTANITKINTQQELNVLKLNETKKLNEIELKQKQQKIYAAEKKVKSFEKIIHLSTENIEKQKYQYEAGNILLSDYNRILNKHNSNQKELWQAQFEYIEVLLK